MTSLKLLGTCTFTNAEITKIGWRNVIVAINVNTITQAEFNTRLRRLLAQLENNRARPYDDSAKPSHPTIGIGFDLTVGAVRSKVFDAMGISATGTLRATLTAAINSSIGKPATAIQTLSLTGVRSCKATCSLLNISKWRDP